MRSGSSVYWLHGDHLGSASLTTNNSGTKVSELRYKPFGEVRWSNGATPTDRTFTGQRSETASAVGSLMDFGARFYSPLTGRFISADSIVPQPGDPQAFNRYAYARNSPLVRVDPSGHADCAAGDSVCWTNEWMWKNRWYEAHGHFWDGKGWNKQDSPRFKDPGIWFQVLSEFYSDELLAESWHGGGKLAKPAGLIPPPGWQPLPRWLGDFFQHEAVVWFATQIRPGTLIHVPVPNGGWYGTNGLLDLFDPPAIWEVKPDKDNWRTLASQQLQNYLDAIPGSKAGAPYNFLLPYNDRTILSVRTIDNQRGVLYYSSIAQTPGSVPESAYDALAPTMAAFLVLLNELLNAAPGLAVP